MLQVDLDNILPEEDALKRITEIFDHVEQHKEVYVITKGGRPVLAIVDIDHLEKDMDGMAVESKGRSAELVSNPSIIVPEPTLELALDPGQPSTTAAPIAPLSMAPPLDDSLPAMPDTASFSQSLAATPSIPVESPVSDLPSLTGMGSLSTTPGITSIPLSTPNTGMPQVSSAFTPPTATPATPPESANNSPLS